MTDPSSPVGVDYAELQKLSRYARSAIHGGDRLVSGVDTLIAEVRRLETQLAGLREQIANEIEALEWAWHFGGPGDPGVEIVSRFAAIAVARGVAETPASTE